MPRSRSRSPGARGYRSRHEEDRGSSKYRDSDRRGGRRDSPRQKDSGSSHSYRESRREDDRPRREDRRDRDRPRDDGYRSRRQENGERQRSRSRSASPSTKAKPNFGNSGLLAAATNTVKHVDGTSTLLKYNEPPEARKPNAAWRLYVFKGKDDDGVLYIEKQSAYLIGRDHAVADIPIDHPSCSKQHAAIQYRQVQVRDEWGGSKAEVKPFIIDLESTNGTHVNGETIPPSRYYELQHRDVIKFGQSTREYVLLNENVTE